MSVKSQIPGRSGGKGHADPRAAQIAKFYLAGASITQCAIVYGRSSTGIAHMLRRQGVQVRAKSPSARIKPIKPPKPPKPCNRSKVLDAVQMGRENAVTVDALVEATKIPTKKMVWKALNHLITYGYVHRKRDNRYYVYWKTEDCPYEDKRGLAPGSKANLAQGPKAPRAQRAAGDSVERELSWGRERAKTALEHCWPVAEWMAKAMIELSKSGRVVRGPVSRD